MAVEIIEFEPRYRDDFKKLNTEWLQKYFVVEPFDEHQLSNPETEILDQGGKIFLARDGEKIIGTSALLKNPDGYELAKMSVTEEYKGQGIGKQLMEHSIAAAKNLGATHLVLLSNRKLSPAINMYRKFGFEEVEVEKCQPYARCDIKMALSLNE